MRSVVIMCSIALAAMTGAGKGRAQDAAVAEKAGAATNAPAAAKPVVVITTSVGAIKLELWPDKAPATVSNFLAYVEQKYYDSLIFHRVIDGFMIQGGGFSPDMQQKATSAPVKNEARADTPNKRGTIAMARTMVPDSATSQFFINLVDNEALNFRNPSPEGIGYCVFGKVVDGQSVVDAIGKVKTGRIGPFSDVPVQPLVIQSVRLADAAKP